jgi:uncharacterized protein (TIGR04255 family)
LNVKVYLSPPITESIIEIIIDGELKPKDFERITKKLKKNYPNLQQINTVGINYGQNLIGSNLTVSHQPTGIRLSSSDETDVLLVSPKNLVIARLAPYLGWDYLNDKFATAWKVWKSLSKIQPIIHIGVRYINRIDIPQDDSGKIENEDYLNIYPSLPEPINKPMFNYITQVTIPTSNELWNATITTANLPSSPLINNISLLLDIVVFRTKEIPLKDEDLFKVLSEARELKNDLFEQCITQKTRELIDK